MSTAIKERPVLFSGPMVRAILEGRKTQTRRIIKPQPPVHIDELHGFEFRKRAPYDIEHLETGAVVGYGFQSSEDDFCKCPYGRPGDRLWVRETCRAEEVSSMVDGVRYAADDAFREIAITQEAADQWCDLFAYGKSRGKNVPSIHMPRWASRITLEITGVRVERLQEISEEDAIAEGVTIAKSEDGSSGYGDAESLDRFPQYSLRWGFKHLWQSINGEGSWAANPWVWVVEFKRLDAE